MNERGEHPIYTEGEPLLNKEEQEELNALRRKQIGSVDGLSDEERARLIQLQEKEEAAREERKAP